VQHVVDTGITCFFCVETKFCCSIEKLHVFIAHVVGYEDNVFLVQNMFCCEYEKFYVLLDMLYIYNENMFFFVAKTCFVTQMRIFMFCMTCCTHTQVARVYSIAFIYIYGCILLGKVHSMLLTWE
jgi:hypothetical protein